MIARDILVALSEPFKLSTGHEVFIGCSIGISIYPDNGSTVAELTKNADAAMYLAKENGRNQFSFYTPELNANARNKLEMENDLRRAILHNELQLHYQPKVERRHRRDLRRRSIGALEKNRWQLGVAKSVHSDRGKVRCYSGHRKLGDRTGLFADKQMEK